MKILTNFQKVLAWHRAFSVPIRTKPSFPSKDRRKLRIELIDEEFKELKRAIRDHDIIEVADGLADILYVTYGAAAEFGIDIDEVFAEVHRSNMSKLGKDGKPVLREDGKVLKGPNFRPPDIPAILKNQDGSWAE